MLGGFKLAALSTLGARLYYLQVIQGDKFRTLAEDNRVRLIPIIPPRGKILDRNGTVLAEGHPRYQILFDPFGDTPRTDVIKKIADIMKFDDKKREDLLAKVSDRKTRFPIMIEDNLNWQQIAKIEENINELPGIDVEEPEVRSYPMAEATAHITGYIAGASKDDEEHKDNRLFLHPDFKVGKHGLEKSFENKLQGKAGVRQVEVNARGSVVRELQTEEGSPGEPITTTINAELQQFAYEQLRGKGGLRGEGGSVVVLDILSGDVLAMASVPSYDPNAFVGGIKPDYWKELLENKDKPLTNKPIAAMYPPGSTFKTITAIAALEAGVVTPETTAFCPGYFQFGNRQFHCWERRGHGHVNLERAVTKSCNVYFFSLSTRLGVDRIADMSLRFGLGAPTGIELPGEKAGLIPTSAWKKKALKQPWYQGETLNMSIGQGYTLATPIQLAVQAARMASFGNKVTPRLVKNTSLDQYEMFATDSGEKILLPRKHTAFEKIDVHEDYMRHVYDGMVGVVNSPIGSVYRFRIEDPQYAFAGKTGTSQVVSNKTFRHMPDKAEEKYHAFFIGFAPIDNPRYAISVVIEHGGYGSAVAAPIAREVLLKAQQIEAGE